MRNIVVMNGSNPPHAANVPKTESPVAAAPRKTHNGARQSRSGRAVAILAVLIVLMTHFLLGPYSAGQRDFLALPP
jgi:hypothetical protein